MADWRQRTISRLRGFVDICYENVVLELLASCSQACCLRSLAKRAQPEDNEEQREVPGTLFDSASYHRRSSWNRNAQIEACLTGQQCKYVQVYEIPSKFALFKYVLECASDVGCCMKPAKTIGDSQKNDTFLIAHACAFCGVGIVFA